MRGHFEFQRWKIFAAERLAPLGIDVPEQTLREGEGEGDKERKLLQREDSKCRGIG